MGKKSKLRRSAKRPDLSAGDGLPLEALDKRRGHTDVIRAVVGHWSHTRGEQAGRPIGEETTEADHSADGFFETTGLDGGLGDPSGRGRFEVVVNAESADHGVGLNG
jgi:hypothetical protein